MRDGQQCPGAGMSFQNNLKYAELAWEARVDVLEAGFPAASNVDFEIVKAIAEEMSSREGAYMIAALCQLRDEQIDRTIEALSPAVKYQRARLHVYLPVDPSLMVASLGERATDYAGLERDVHDFIRRATDAGLEVEFSPEGYSRMGENFEFVTNLIRRAVEAGASVINCPDTIGGGSRYQGAEFFVRKMSEHAEIIRTEYPTKNITWSAHCHNDFGLALDNTLAAVFEGPVRQIEGCINGIGERAGNVALEQCVMAIRHFSSCVETDNPFYTTVRTEKLKEISDFVSTHMLPRQPHFPVTGANAMKHSAGGHTNAILKNPLVYQPFEPSVVGAEISLLFGPLSGGNHAKSIIEGFGYRCENSEKVEVAQFIKDFYKERRKGVTDEELLLGYFEFRKAIDVHTWDYSRSSGKSEVRIEGKFFEREGVVQEAHVGRDSALAALKKLIDSRMPGFSIRSHKSESDGAGINAESVSTIVLQDEEGGVYEGKGRDQDIEISAMKALVAAVNIAYTEKNFRKA